MSEVNEELVQKYKNDKVLIKTYYTDSEGVNVDGIVNPLRIDNRQLMSPTDNQTRYPACAGYSACTLLESICYKQTGRLIQLDAKQVYAKAKELDGEMQMDGTYLETSLQAALSLSDYDFLKGASVGVFTNGRNRDTIEKTKFLIHKYDFVQAGFMIDTVWYDSNNEDFIIKSGGIPLGGHAVNLVGYDSTGVYVMNQWGPEWGSKGFSILPWDLFIREFMYGAYITGIRY